MDLINYFKELFGIIWQNSVFHWAALILLGVAVWGEYNAVKRYRRYQSGKSRLMMEAIAYLNEKLDGKVSGIKKLQSDETTGENWSSLLDWFGEHLVGDFSADDKYAAEVHRGRFLLLQYPAFLTRPVPRSQWRFVPSILVAIGVLGTFYGIQQGLQNIGLGDLNNTGELLPSIRQLLEGMKTAFSTSLMGLGSSSIFTIVLAWGEQERQKQRDSLRSQLDKIATLQTPGQMFARINPDSSREAAVAITSAAETMQTGFAQMVEAQRELNPRQIGIQVGMAMTPVFQHIRQELATLRQIKADWGQEIINNMIQGLRTEVIEPVVGRLDQSAQLTTDASLAVRELKTELGSISQSLAESILTIQNFQQDTLVQLQEFASNLQQILGQFQTDTQGVLQQMATEIRAGVAESIEGMKAQRTAFQESAQDASATFRGIQENLQAALQTQAEQEQKMLAGLQERMMNILNASHTAFQTQSSTIQAVGSEASQLMNQARENLVTSLQNVDGMLQNTRVTVQQELEQFRINYQASLQQFFTEQNNLLESSLGKQRQGLAQVVVTLQQVFREESEKRKLLAAQVDQNMEKIQETVVNVSNFANSVGLNSSERLAQLQVLAKLTGKEVLRVETTYQNMVKQLNEEGKRMQSTYENMVGQLDRSLQLVQEQVKTVENSYQNMVEQFNQALEVGNHQLIDYLEKANQSQTNFFTQSDSEMANVCSSLQETSNGLMQVAHYLVAAADNLGTKNGNIK
ncbi:hypothetical protein [Microseira wollei]|uniref:MotA/TolQ/ExbB proton channel domain-containing protein n=1 Tax=Microseira wollei NIES-4236 TaxID=2530354 RepID=A0AAV3XGL1_9CYAN|nr:hypothetical protein [Microseira wollei]GET39866.1 hypothetical protein MiSe_46380 [Microseira wollei NIES-4236]